MIRECAGRFAPARRAVGYHPLAVRRKAPHNKRIEQTKIFYKQASTKFSLLIRSALACKRMKNNEISQLNPWRVICGFLFELDSYFIPEIIDKTGLAVDWSLSERENYSHKYRKDAYRPRINAAYNGVSDEGKLRVAFCVAHELTKRIESEKINNAL